MAEPDIQRYLNGIASQHCTKPRYMAHLTEILEKIDAATGAANDMALAFYIDTAAGKQLDIIGRLVGVSRTITFQGFAYGTVVDDEQYRTLLYAKIFANHWDGTIETFHDIWSSTLGKMINAYYIDNQDMTVDIIVDGIVPEMLLKLIPYGHIIPKPMGVRYAVRNRLPAVVGRNKVYIGIALYGSCSHVFGPVEMPNLDEDYLLDGLGEILLDGHGVALT